MKHFLLCIFLIFVSLVKSQIQNPGFEAVTAGKPDNYNLGFYSTYNIKDTSDAHSGAKAALIRGYGDQMYTTQGAVLGIFGISGKPEALNGWYKCFLQPGDSLVFNPYVYETTLSSPFALAYAFTTTSTAVYKQFSAPISYATFTGTSVDTLYTGIYLSGPSYDANTVHIPATGTWAIIDDLTLGPIVSVEEQTNILEMEQVYPQPASAYLNLIYVVTKTADCSLSLYDITGKEVKNIFRNEKQSPGRYKAELGLHDLSPGLYFVQLKTGTEIKNAKVVKE